jgi:desulfoferrodoxin (superoxide reductase-like protein)
MKVSFPLFSHNDFRIGSLGTYFLTPETKEPEVTTAGAILYSRQTKTYLLCGVHGLFERFTLGLCVLYKFCHVNEICPYVK